MNRPISLKTFISIILFIATTFFFISSNKLDAPEGMVLIHGGKFLMGSENGLQDEAPIHSEKVKDFYLDKNLVSIKQFEEFVKATGYITDAEKFGNGAVYNFTSKEWELADSADWEFPLGKSFNHSPSDHPVTQVSWQDAMEYCKWAGKRLPTEAEWEFAARQGMNSADRYSWGNELFTQGKFHANVWEGSFPINNTVSDGFYFTSPVGYFGETRNGLSDMGGNVWQWCSDSYHLYKNKTIPDELTKVLRGGSFLCDSNVCHGYRVSARMYSTQETSTFHVGFRCAKDVLK